MSKFLSLLILTFAFVGCSHLTSVSQTQIPAKKGRVVNAEVEKNIIFFFNFDNKYVEDLNRDLLKKCPQGDVKGILTKHESITYFPIIWHKVRVTAEGYCNG